MICAPISHRMTTDVFGAMERCSRSPYPPVIFMVGKPGNGARSSFQIHLRQQRAGNKNKHCRITRTLLIYNFTQLIFLPRCDSGNSDSVFSGEIYGLLSLRAFIQLIRPAKPGSRTRTTFRTREREAHLCPLTYGQMMGIKASFVHTNRLSLLSATFFLLSCQLLESVLRS